jgi:hypothetical protein
VYFLYKKCYIYIMEAKHTNREEKRAFNKGDKVLYTNDNSVIIGEKTIIGTEKISYSDSGNGYYVDPTDTPWYAIKEENLKLIS